MRSQDKAKEDSEESEAELEGEAELDEESKPKVASSSIATSGRRSSLARAGPDDIVIRTFRPGDLGEVMELDHEVFGGYDPMVFTTFYEYYPKTTLVAERLGTVVGFVLGFKHSPLEGRVFWLAVKPGYQSRGIGRRLLTNMLKLFRMMGSMSATLEVRISNAKAQALYTSMGFVMTSISPGYYSDGEAAIIMRRSL
jgi:[ribosomal protein S18]-alanine N-acetyltransferase